MQSNLFQRLFKSLVAPVATPPGRSISAPVELQAAALEQVAGGGSPNGGWTNGATTSSPNGGWC